MSRFISLRFLVQALLLVVTSIILASWARLMPGLLYVNADRMNGCDYALYHGKIEVRFPDRLPLIPGVRVPRLDHPRLDPMNIGFTPQCEWSFGGVVVEKVYNIATDNVVNLTHYEHEVSISPVITTTITLGPAIWLMIKSNSPQNLASLI